MQTLAPDLGALACPPCTDPLLEYEFAVFGVHYECHMRLVFGGANHQDGTCSCCGGSQPPDPPGLTKREAARLAMHKVLVKGRAP